MNVLVVYSHPNPKSFNHAIKETLVKRLEEKGAAVCVRDLYDLNFDPVLKAQDLALFKEGKASADIKVEPDHVRWADMMFFVCPVWWGGVTANMRGYFDRVFSLGFAYAYSPNGVLRLLKGKKAYLINTLGESNAEYERIGMFKSIKQTLDEVIFDFCGVTVVGHAFFGSVMTCLPEDRAAMLDEVKQIADKVLRG